MLDARAREAVIRKIAALMAKTTANGCTEHEAAAAAGAAARLMDEYQLGLSDVHLEQDGCEMDTILTGRKDGGHMFYLIGAIARFTDTRAWRVAGAGHNGNAAHKFFGLKTDVIVARYIYQVLDDAIWRSWEHHRIHDVPGYTALSNKQKNAVKAGFMTGIVSRLIERLREMKEDRTREMASTGRDLVPVKGAIVKEEFAKLGIHLKTGRGGYSGGADADSYWSGRRAADTIQLVKAIER